MNSERKKLYWESSAKRDFKEFPIAVQKDMGVALFVVQLGGMPDTVKAWHGCGPGVHQLSEDCRGNAYRAVFTLQIASAVYVLHAFQKKSTSGIATPLPDINLVGKRLKLLAARNQRRDLH